MLGLLPGDLSGNSLYAAADALWQRHERIESAVFARECQLFGMQPRIVFYDLTNTYHCGRSRNVNGRGITYNWKSIRERMRTLVRLTTAVRTAEGKVWSQRQDVDPNNDQARVAAAAGVSFRRHRRTLPLEPAKIARKGA